MSTNPEVLVGLEINHRSRQILVKTMVRGKGRHNSYPNLSQAPEAVRGEALVLIREALQRAGYGSLAELDAALATGPVTPEATEAQAEAPPAAQAPETARQAKSKRTLGDEALPLDDPEFEMGGG